MELISLDYGLENSNTLKDKETIEENNLVIFDDTTRWLNIYVSNKMPDFTPRYRINGFTPFRKDVLNIVKDIPYEKVITYSDIATQIAKKRNMMKMSSQAVGGAVGFNPICIIIPCHRVMGKNNNITGYTEGIEKKVWLLNHEGYNITSIKYPKIERTN